MYVTTNWKQWVDEQLQCIYTSGLNAISNINVVLLHRDDMEAQLASDYIHDMYGVVNIIKIHERDPKPRQEGHTLKIIHDHCKQNIDDKILYLHTKGISRPYTDNIQFPSNDKKPWVYNWRNCMQHHCVFNHKKCIEDLENHDAVGTRWYNQPAGYPPHFSGNFWWANAKYINTLQDPLTFSRYWKWGRFSCEFWIGGSYVPCVSGAPRNMKPIRGNPSVMNYPFSETMFR